MSSSPNTKSPQNPFVPCPHRSQVHFQHILLHDPNWPITLFPLHDLHALPRPPRRTRSRRWLLGHRIRQHHWLLCSLWPRHGNGTHLRPGLRSQKVQTSRPHHAENRPPSSPNFTFHLILLAQHQETITLMWARRRHSQWGTTLYILLSPRSYITIAAAPSKNLSSKPINNSSSHVLRRSLHYPPRAHQLPLCLRPRSRNRRHRVKRCRHKLQPRHVVGYLRCGMGHAQENVAGYFLVVLQRVEKALESRDSELRLGLSGMVVVRDNDFTVRVVGEPSCKCCLHGGFDSNHGFDIHFSIVFEFWSVHACRKRVGCGESSEGENCGACGTLFQFRVGVLCFGVRDFGEEGLGDDVHRGWRNPRFDVDGVAHHWALRARELSPNDGLRRFEGDGAAEIGGEHKLGLLLPCGHAGCGVVGVLCRVWLQRVVAGDVGGARVLYDHNDVRVGADQFGGSSFES